MSLADTRRHVHHHARPVAGSCKTSGGHAPASRSPRSQGHTLRGSARSQRRRVSRHHDAPEVLTRQSKLECAYSMVRALGGRGDHVRLLAHDNSSLGPAQPWTAEIADLPYVVPLGNKHGRFSTVALDFDAKLGEPGDAATHADIVCSLLDEAGFPYVLARSGPSEGRHVFFIVRGPGGVEVGTTRLLVRRLIALGLTTLDPSCMSSVQSCIRPPGAPHRAGGVSTPLVSWETAVDRLRSDRPDAPRRSDVVEFVDALAGAGDMRLELQPTSTAIAGAPGSSAGVEYA